MKTHSTNYVNTFILIADDCSVTKGEWPPEKGDTKTIANLQFEKLLKEPYRFTSDEIIFDIFATRSDIPKKEWAAAKEQFFSKGQPCLRSSPLPKRYGWGIHYNEEGRMALYPCESKEYKAFSKDKTLKVIKAMRSSKK